MAEVHIIGQILQAIEFDQPHLFCKWSLQSGTSWKIIEGEIEGHTPVSSHRLETSSVFSHPLDIHLATVSVLGWPKLHVEVYAINALQNSWPVGYGFIHIPNQPGLHQLQIRTWKVSPKNLIDRIRDKFGGGSVTLTKADIIYTGEDRYKIGTKSSGKIILKTSIILRNFLKFGIEYN